MSCITSLARNDVLSLMLHPSNKCLGAFPSTLPRPIRSELGGKNESNDLCTRRMLGWKSAATEVTSVLTTEIDQPAC